MVTTPYSAVISEGGDFTAFTNTISGQAGGKPVLGPLDDSDADAISQTPFLAKLVGSQSWEP